MRTAAALIALGALACAPLRTDAADFKACRGDKSDINALLGVPRVNLGFGAASNNLGEYESPVQICADDDTQICAADWVDDLSADLLIDQGYGSDNPESWINYAQSLVVYSFVGVFFAIFAVLAGIIALCIRCCCCKGVGVAVKEDPDATEDENGAAYYPMWQTVTTYFCLVFFIIIVFTFTMLAHVRGNQGFTDAQLALVEAPNGLAELAQGVSDPAVELLTDVLGNTSLNLIERVNETFFTVGTISVLHESVTCARELYDELTNRSLVDGFLDVLTDVEISLATAPDALSIDAAIAIVRADIASLLAAVDDTQARLTVFQNAFAAIDLPDIEAQVTALSADLTSLRADVQALEAKVQAYVTLQDDMTALDATITPLLGVDYTVPMVTSFKSAYATFDAGLTALPTAAGLAADMAALNTTLDAVDASLATLETTLLDAQTELSAVDLAALDASLSGVVAAIDAFNLTGLRAEVGVLLTFAQTLPSVTPVTDKIQEVLALRDRLPCVFNASSVPQNINDNLVELPSELLNLTANLEVLNDTITDATAELELVLADIDSFSGSFNGTLQSAAADFDTQIDAANATLQSARAVVVAFQVELAGVDTNVLNLTGALTSIADMRLQLNDPNLRPTPASLAAITASGGARTTLEGALVTLLATGFLGRVDAVEATAVQDWNCEVALTACWDRSAGSFTTCGVNFCEYPQEGWTQLQALLTAFSASITAVSPSLRDDVLPQLGVADDSLGAADLTCCTDLSALEALETELDAAVLDVSAARSSILAINASLSALETDFANLVNVNATFAATFGDIRTQLQAFNTTTLLGDLDQLEEIFDREEGIWGLLTVGLVRTFAELRVDRLRDIANGPGGLQAMILHVATELDLAIAEVEPAQATLVSRLDDIRDIVNILDALRDNDGSTRAVGSIYYLQRAVAAATNDSSTEFPPASDFDVYDRPTVLGSIENGVLVDYPNGAKCLSNTCMRNAVEFYNSDSIENVAPQDINDIVALPMSRETLTGLPFIIPGFVLLIAVSVFFLPQCGYCLACCSVCIMPWLFFLIGGLVFPFLLLTADTCASAEAVGVTALQELTPLICAQINGTLSAQGFCSFVVDQPPLGNMTIELDPPELLKSLLLDCSGSSGANLAPGAPQEEPVNALIASFGLEASQIVQSQIAELLDNILPDLGVVLRPLLRADVEASSPDLVGDVQQLSASVNSALGCAKFNDAYLGFKDTFCCDFASAFYWSFAGWYLMAFAMLLCGLPVGCFAATRLRNIKRSRAQMREFYQRTGETIAASGVGRAATTAYATAYARIARADSSTQVATAQIVDEDGQPTRGNGSSRLAGMGAALGSSFRRGKERAQDSARSLQQRMRDVAARRQRVADNERLINEQETGGAGSASFAATAKVADPEEL